MIISFMDVVFLKGLKMKKSSLAIITFGILFTLAIFNISTAEAQRKNTTSHDVEPVNLTAENVMENIEDSQVTHYRKDKKHHKMGKENNKHYKYQDKYEEALKRIDKSSFSPEQKELLIEQARENLMLAEKQMQERKALAQQQMQKRSSLDMKPMLKDKGNRKAVKSVNAILKCGKK